MNIYKAYAKVNIFLKITGTRGDYHEIISRFMKIDSLFDELWFVPKTDNEFEIIGDFNCTTTQNTIYKAYKALLEYTSSQDLIDFFQKNSVHVNKKIPSFAGLGGGSSDAATFLHMCNDALSLGLDVCTLAKIGAKVGADVPFFIYGYKSANVSGIGELVEEFFEEPLELEIYTPKLEISTPMVYQTYRKSFFNPVDAEESQKLCSMNSAEVLQKFSTKEANDLFMPAIALYPKLLDEKKSGYFFSGSGSSFFRVKG
jgi:4-diphosphocytidyl-2-C-methyl-D-erythritol kinase